MGGHIRRRSSGSFEIKYEAGADRTGRRQTKYLSFKGSKREAQAKLAELLAAARPRGGPGARCAPMPPARRRRPRSTP